MMRSHLFMLSCRAALIPGLLLPALLLNAQTRVATTPASSPAIAPPTPDAAMADLVRFMDRATKLKDNDVEGRLTLARWARDRQMWSQAADMAQAALYRDPGNRAAYLILQQIDEARPLPEEPEVEEALKAEFAKRFSREFKTRNTKHFVLCYDTTDAFAAQRGASMERVYDAFQFYFNMNTLRPDFLERRLPVILFKDREDYLAYIRQTERANLSWSSGFYSQRTNRSAFFDDASGASMASYNKQAGDLRTKIEGLNKQLTAANAQNQLGLVNTLSVERNRAAETLAQINNRAGNTITILNNVKTMHEAAHQVAFNMGIQKRMIDYPMWLSEGLACGFEVEDAAGRRGPAVMNWGRISVLKEQLKADKIIPIEQFVGLGQPDKMDEPSLALFYAEGWGLFHYLYRFERAGMEKYLMSYLVHPPMRQIGAEERKRIFAGAFGDDWEGLDKKFQAYLKALPAKAP